MKLTEKERSFVSSYISRPFPWVCSSDISGDEFCPNSGYVNSFLRDHQDFETDERKLIIGSNGHVIFCNFFDEIDDELLAKMPIQMELEIEKTQIFAYFLSALHKVVMTTDPDLAGSSILKRVLFNFAKVRTIDYRRIVIDCGHSSPEIVRTYFKPALAEFYMEDPVHQYHGKLDALFNSTKPENGPIYKIDDWKTGDTPKSIKDGKNDVRTRYKRQVNGYAWLRALNLGLIDPKGNTMLSMFEVAVEFLGGDTPGAFCRKASKRSVDALIGNISKYRLRVLEYLHGVTSRDKTFPKKISIYTCKNCSIRMMCLTEEEYKKLVEVNAQGLSGVQRNGDSEEAGVD